MELTEQRLEDGAVAIAIAGELDIDSTPRLRERLLRSIVVDGRQVTTLDLERCTFIDSIGLCAIVEAGHLLDRNLQQLRIANLRGQPKELFTLTLVDKAPFVKVVNGADGTFSDHIDPAVPNWGARDFRVIEEADR